MYLSFHSEASSATLSGSFSSGVKSGLMLGLGETEPEIKSVLKDLVSAGCGILTLGQYLAPSKNHAPVERYLEPSEFEEWKATAVSLGFKAVLSSPLARSSYRAAELYGEWLRRER